MDVFLVALKYRYHNTTADSTLETLRICIFDSYCVATSKTGNKRLAWVFDSIVLHFTDNCVYRESMATAFNCLPKPVRHSTIAHWL